LLRKIIISGKMRNEEPLRVGAGPGKAALSPTDLVVLKVTRADGLEVPVIPGSSLKGLFRATCVSLVRALELGACDGLPRATCLRGNEFDNIEGSSSREVEDKISLIARMGVCPLCLLFGSPGLASHVDFDDCYPVSKFKFGYRTCVAIDRRKGSAAPGALFTVEYVEPGCEWNFELRADNTPNYLLGLLMEVVELINAGLVKVGGMKSKGFGRVSISINSIKVVSLDHERYGVSSERKLRRLDPIDVDVMWHGPLPKEGSWSVEAEGEDARRVIDDLREAWRSCATRLRELYDGRKWRWEVALNRGGP